MQADFLDSHRRHWDDAEHLFDAGRWAGADHLYGMATECGLKQLMMMFGMVVDLATGRPADRKDWVHADGIWARFESYRIGHAQGAGYTLPIPDPFDDWDVSDRYAHRSHFNFVRAGLHRLGAHAVCQLIKKAQMQGLI